VLPENGAER